METAELLSLRMRKPPVSEAEIVRVCEQLKGRGWLHRRILARELGISLRRLRKIAEHSEGRILSSPGSPGYRVFDSKAACEDADRCACQHESQAKRELARAAAIRRRYHRFARG